MLVKVEIQGLSLGADDYVLKPFSPRELIARVKANLRRAQDDTLLAESISFQDGDLVIRPSKHEVYKSGNLVNLTPNEYKLLLTFALEQALVQAVLWTAILAIVLAIVISLFVAKRITAPLVQMRSIAERMAKGELTSRTEIKGADEIADLGHSLNYLAEQLLLQEQLRKTMTADVAHELRTPLTTLKSHMEAMIEGVWDPTPKRLESCFEEIERLRFLVGNLEQLTEMESPGFKLKLRDENIAAIVQHHIGQIKPLLKKKECSCFSKLREMSGLMIGIDEKELSFVFERFYRVDKSRDRKSGGSGIGLTIVKKLVEAHGGTIEIQSQIGKGTTARLHIPKLQ